MGDGGPFAARNGLAAPAFGLGVSPLVPASSSGKGSLRFAGYAALFDRVDRAGDVFRTGAFVHPAAVPLLWQHAGTPVGSIDRLAQDARGLRVDGVIDDAAVARMVRAGTLAGLSVGYRRITVRQGARRELLRVQLVEVSLVAVPMQAAARVDTIF